MLKTAVVETGDASLEGTAAGAIEACIKKFGSFDGLYHVAGGSGRRFGDGPLHDLSKEGWEQTMSLNLTSLMLSNQAAIRSLLQMKKGGTILNMSSVLGYSPSPQYFVTHAYAAAKAAVFGFIITLMGCYHGYYSGKGAQGVGAATTHAVVSSSVLILLFNYIITELFFAI